jgi:hypothetical protein
LTKEELFEHRTELLQLMDQAKANFHAYEGALQECDYWLDKLTEKVSDGE